MLQVDNYAPNMDAITIRDENNFTISVSRDEHGKISIVVQEHGGFMRRAKVRHYVLGRKKADTWPTLEQATAKKVRAKKEKKR